MWELIWPAIIQTFIMVLPSTVFSLILGFILAILLVESISE